MVQRKDVSPESRYRLRSGMRVRGESFGALVYDPESEGLYVVRPRAAMALLSILDGKSTLREAVGAAYSNEGALLPALTLVGRLLDWGVVDEV